MATTASYSEYPYIIWKISSLPSIQQLTTNYFYYDGSRFFLSLNQETSIDVENDYFSMYLEEWGTWTDGIANFMITVCVKDKSGQCCFVQTTEITESVLENRVQVWHMKRLGLISRYSDIAVNNVITLVCTIGPDDMDAVRRQWGYEKSDKSVQVSLPVDERSLNTLSNDFLSSFEDGRETDVILLCDDGSRLSAHKAILSARSEVFSAMFRNNMSESKSGVVKIVNVAPIILFHFLKYLYSGRLDSLTDKTAYLLYAVGDRYAVIGLKERCSDFMVKNLSKKNVFEFIVLADRHNDANFADSIACYLSRNDSLLKENAWLDFWQSEPHLAFEMYKAYVNKCTRPTRINVPTRTVTVQEADFSVCF